MTITYLLSFLDKVTLGQASIFGILQDTVRHAFKALRNMNMQYPNVYSQHLVGSQYSWASSIFYFGYLLAQYPSSLLMQKLPLGRYFGVMITLWGVATTCQAAAKDFATLAVSRFFLGAFETCISPVLTILVGQYWTRREHPLRSVVWWAGAGVGGFIGDAITYAISGEAYQHGTYSTWQVCCVLKFVFFKTMAANFDCSCCFLYSGQCPSYGV